MAAPVRSEVAIAGNAEGGPLVEPGEYTADANINFQRVVEADGIVVVIDWTAETDAGASIVYTLQGRVPGTSIVWDLGAVTVTAVGTAIIEVSDALNAATYAADVAIAGKGNHVVPPNLNLKIDAADTKRVTYSVHVYFSG